MYAKDGYKVLAFPNTPQKYANNLDYTWTVADGLNHRLKVQFGFLDLEPSRDCTNDFVAFHDGPR